MAPSARRNRLRAYKQKLHSELNRDPTSFPKTQDPRGRILKKATHSYLDIDEMPHVVRRATEVQKLLEQDATGLHAYEAPQLVCPLKFQLIRSAAALKKSEIDTCLGLVEQTSGHVYRASSIGWHPRKKKEEMMDKEMIYLLVRQGDVGGAAEHNPLASSEEDIPDVESQASPQLHPLEQIIHDNASDSDEEDSVSKPTTRAQDTIGAEDVDNTPLSKSQLEWPLPSNNGRILGFVSFMFTYDDPPYEDREVVYMYEIHLHERLRGRGLGSNLIKFVEHAARYCGISKVMLTVFTANEGAKALYEKLGYTEDICSPTDRIMRNKVVKPDFLIMSKEIAYAL